MCYLCSDRKRWQQTLIRITFSVVLWRGRNTGNKYLWGLWGVLVVNGKHRVCQSPRWCALLRSNHSRFWCSMRAQSQVGHVSHALPRPKLLRVRPVLGVQSQVDHASHALPRPKLLRFPGVLWRASPRWAMYVPLFPGPTSPDSPVLCQGTVPGVFFVSCTSLA